MQEPRSSLIKAITSPLGFFALALLIIEGFLAIVLNFSDLTPAHKFVGMLVGAALFCGVVFLVWWLVKNYPKNLTFGEESHLEEERMHNYGSSDQPTIKAVIEDLSRTTEED